MGDYPFICDDFADFPATPSPNSAWNTEPFSEIRLNTETELKIPEMGFKDSEIDFKDPDILLKHPKLEHPEMGEPIIKEEMRDPKSELDLIIDCCTKYVPTKPSISSDMLVCEWDGCFQTFPLSENASYLFHVQTHAHFMAQMVHEKKYKEFICWWDDCIKPDTVQGITDELEFARHILYHPFHYKAKVIGLQALEQSALQVPCQLECGSRNVVPDFPTVLACKWDECDVGFNCISAFEDHVRGHIEDLTVREPNQKAQYKCLWEGCVNFCVKDKTKIQEHIQKHTNLRKFACSNCGGTFYNKNKFLDHFRRQAKVGSGYILERVVYQCSQCSKKFQTESLLRDHIRSHIHNYMCQYCHMTFPTPSALRKHILYRHKSERKFACGQCDYRAKEAFDLRVHVEKHKDNRPKLQCPECDYKSYNYDSMSLHMKMKHAENEADALNYICHICSKKFGEGRCLSRHLVRMHEYRRPPGVDKFRYCQGPDGFFRLRKVQYESKKLLQTKELQKKAADKLLSLGVTSEKEFDLVVRSETGEEKQMKFVSYKNALKELSQSQQSDEEIEIT